MTRWFDSNICLWQIRSAVEQRLHCRIKKSSLFYFVIPDAAKAEVVSSSAAT
jgi:hypothetical protein